ncbi:KilA-N domain-containing protein [soil metagenome]
MAKSKKITVNDTEITIVQYLEEDYISLTDMVRNYEGSHAIIGNWLRSKNTIEYLTLWEQMHNDKFKLIESDEFRINAGDRRFTLSPQQWVDKTNAIGIKSKAGRYGGTYAHKDIAFKFASWLSPQFELYLIKEFQRLKQLENSQHNLEWSVRRTLSKVNYSLHTDAIKEHIIPTKNSVKDKTWLIYAEEADLLNVSLFGYTAKQWRDVNPTLVSEGKNIRDIASINELTVLSNMESLNSIMIKERISKEERFAQLCHYAQDQLKALNKTNVLNSIKHHLNSSEPLSLGDMENLD